MWFTFSKIARQCIEYKQNTIKENLRKIDTLQELTETVYNTK